MPQKLPDDVSVTTAFVVLAAIAARPRSHLELCHTTLMAGTTVKDRLKELENLGWIVQRASDRRWVMRVLLAPLEAPEPTGMPGEVPRRGRKTTRRPVLGNLFKRPIRAQDESEAPEAPEVVEIPPEAVDYRSASERMAEKWSLPIRLAGVDGEISTGRLAPCVKCGRVTPIRYGDTPICPKCSRVWGEEPVNG